MKRQLQANMFTMLLLALCSSPMAQPSWNWTIVDSLPHPVSRFTQGLSWDGQTLWESTGMVGRSTLYHSDRKARVMDSVRIPEPHFGEGSVRVRDEVFVLTWQSGVGFIYDAKTLQKKGEFPIPTDGWGLTQKDGLLWMSNGSPDILQLTADSQQMVGRLHVENQGRPVERLNELEMTSSYLLANIWYSDSVAVIQPRTGNVEAWLNLAAITKAVHSKTPKADVLNGLAWDGKLLWVTGKLWPRIYAIKVERLK